MELKVGNIVQPLHPQSQPLRSGAEWYPHAIVVQVKPLVLVSEGTDMRWESTVQDRKFVVLGTASAELLERCMKRL